MAFGKRPTDLISTRSQRLSGTVIALTPVAFFLAMIEGSVLLAVMTSEGSVPSAGNTCRPARCFGRN